MTSLLPKRRVLRILTSIVSLAVAASLTNLHGNSQEAITHGPWQISVFATGGFPPNYALYFPPGFLQQAGASSSVSVVVKEQLDLLNGGAQIGRVLAAPRGRGLLRGQGEAIIEITPFWIAHYPSQAHYYCFAGSGCSGGSIWGPINIPGASITPLLFRWNFTGGTSGPFMPWVQVGGGLLWTNHKFPAPDPLIGFSTSVINFTPQGGIGESIFLRKNRSLDFAAKVVHISNAGLGKSNPGLDYTLQFSAGYSWWK